MKDPLRVSGKDLGGLALADSCARCYWVSRRAPDGLPYQIFPGIFSSIDSYTKKVVHQWFDEAGAPVWLASLGALTGYEEPPHFSKFHTTHAATGIKLTGAPDAIFTRADGTLVIGDYKTSRFTDTQDALLPIYEVQLTAYAYIARALGWKPVSAIALIYMEPRTESSDAKRGDVGHDRGFLMSFHATIKPLKLDLDRIEPLLLRYRDIVSQTTPPAGRVGCKDCAKLDGVIALIANGAR